MSGGDTLWHLSSAVAKTDRMADLLPLFHERAKKAGRGRVSVLLRLNSRTNQLQADSASGLESLGPEPWLVDPAERAKAEACWTSGTPVAICSSNDLKQRLGTPAAILAPLQTRDTRLGLLLLGVDDAASLDAYRDEISAVGDLLSLALERARFRRDADLREDLRELSANLARAVSSSLHLGATLEVFCVRAARLLAADRVSVWLHDRRARRLELTASSDGSKLAAAPRIVTDDASVPVSAVMRQTRAQVFLQSDENPPDVLAPLKGRRRALGTLEFNGVRIETGDAVDVLDRVEEVARQLSVAIENVWLLDEVLRSRRQLESTFHSLTDLVVVTDTDFRITQANRGFASRVGREPHELAGHPLSEFFSRDAFAWIEHSAAATGAPDPERQLEEAALGGTFLVTVTRLVGGEDAPAGTVVVARDVTLQTRLAAEKLELRNRLTQSEKLAALGQFVAGIAHELNNPLQSVLGHVELMLQDVGPGGEFRRDLKVVYHDADRAAKIVHNLLVFAGSRRITRRRLNVNRVVEKVVTRRAAACAAASIAVVKNLAPKLPRVAGDSLLLQQALLNIVVNAEQAMAGLSGTRRLRVETRVVDREIVEVIIADTGPGLSPQAVSRLFEPFFTTKDVGMGTGLGLAISYGIVQEHGGHLHARNDEDGGAVFTIALPAGGPEAVE